MNRDVIDRIRSASFPQARRGYERREVDQFLDEIADWLETGGTDEARAHLVRGELERIGEQTTAILTEAHDAAETMRLDADREVRKLLTDANLKAEGLRTKADEYAEEVREDADAYARRVRSSADAETQELRAEAETAVADARAEAERETSEARAAADSALAEAKATGERTARQVVEEANRRRGEIEKVIADLEQRRTTVIGELRRLASDVAGAAGESSTAAEEPDRPPAAEDEVTRRIETNANEPVGDGNPRGD